MIACIGIGISLGWAITAFIPEEEPSPDILRVPEEPEELVTPEEPEETETPRVPLIDQIIANGSLIIGTSADYPPYENISFPSGDIIGFDIDLAAMIADELNVTLQIINMNFDSLIAACVTGTFDMIVAAMMYTPNRAEILAPSITYINVSQVIIANNNSGFSITSINNVTSYTVGVQTGTVMYDELGPDGLNMIVGVELFVYDNANDLMVALDGGAIDLAYIDEPVFTAWKGIYDIEVLFSTGSDSLVIWCRWEEPELQYVINKVIFEAYQTGTIYDLIMAWFG